MIIIALFTEHQLNTCSACFKVAINCPHLTGEQMNLGGTQLVNGQNLWFVARPEWRSSQETDIYKCISVFKNNLTGNKRKKMKRKERKRRKEGWRREKYCNILPTADTLHGFNDSICKPTTHLHGITFLFLLIPRDYTPFGIVRRGLWLVQNNDNFIYYSPCLPGVYIL